MEPWDHSDWPLPLASTSSREHICLIFRGGFFVLSISALLLLPYQWSKAYGIALSFPEDVFEAEKKIDLLQRDSDNYFPNAQTPKWLHCHIFLPSITLCHCVASVYLCIMNHWYFIPSILAVLFFLFLFSFLQKTTSVGPVSPVILHIHSRKQLLSQIDYALKSQGRQRKYYHHFVNKEPRHREIKWFTQGHPEHPVKAKNWTHVSWVSIKWFNYKIKDLLCIPDISPLRHGNKTFSG